MHPCRPGTAFPHFVNSVMAVSTRNDQFTVGWHCWPAQQCSSLLVRLHVGMKCPERAHENSPMLQHRGLMGKQSQTSSVLEGRLKNAGEMPDCVTGNAYSVSIETIPLTGVGAFATIPGMEKIIIKNCGPIREAELTLKDFLVLIGPQAGGKSTVSKAIYFGKSLRDELFIYLRDLVHDAEAKILKSFHSKNLLGHFSYTLGDRFEQIFGPEFSHSELSIHYEFKQGVGCSITPKRYSVSVDYTEVFLERFENIHRECRDAADRLRMMGQRFATAREIAKRDSEKRLIDGRIARLVNDLFSEERDTFFVPAVRSLVVTLADQRAKPDHTRVDFLTWGFSQRVLGLKQHFGGGLRELIEEESDRLDLHEIARLKTAQRLIQEILRGSYGFDQDIDKLWLFAVVCG